MRSISEPKFIVDHNVGKLARWLRLMGYDTLFFDGEDDSTMVAIALDEGRVILTRDTQIMKRRVVTSGQLRAILLQSDRPELQMRYVIDTLHLNPEYNPFSICLECNEPLVARDKGELKDLVPPYVFETQEHYMECPACHRVYWRGMHWQAMMGRLAEFGNS